MQLISDILGWHLKEAELYNSHMPLSREFQTVGAESPNAHFVDLDLSERCDKACN